MADEPACGSSGKFLERFEILDCEKPSYKWWVLGSVMIGTFMAVLDATIVNVGLPKIMASFGVSVDKVEWVLTGYLLIFGVMLPTSAWFADRYGHKKIYFFSLMLFTFGSFLCGLAWNENVLIFFRLIQGTGAGFMMPVGLAIIVREFPPERRGVALGFWAISAAASVSLGPPIGGYLIDNLGWQAIFDVNVPVGVIAMAATAVIQREYKLDETRSLDILGFLSITAFLAALLLALADANAAWNIGGWTSRFTLTCLAISAVGLVVFLITELTVKHPLIDLRLFKYFNFALSNAILFIFGVGMFGSTFLLPLYLQNSLGYTAFQAGAVFLPVGLIQGLTSPIAGITSDRINAKFPILIGFTLLALSLYLNSHLSLYTEHHQIMNALYIRGLGLGLIFAPLGAVSLSEIPRERMAQASGLFNVIRQIGGSFGVAILGTMLTRRTIFHTAMYGQAVDANSPIFRRTAATLGQFAQHAVGGTASDAAARGTFLVASNVQQQAFIEAVNDDFLIAAVITIIVIVPAVFLRRRKKPMETMAAARPAEAAAGRDL